MITHVKLTDNFLAPYYKLVLSEMIPYQWEVLNDRVEGAAKSHCIENIRIAAGQSEGEFYGYLFQDSDIAKWIEAVAYCLQNGDGAEYEPLVDEAVQLIEAAQEPDGYFNTYFQLTAPERKLTNLFEAHEFYCLGHLIEAAVAYKQATGKDALLNVTLRFIDLIDKHFGDGTGKKRGYDGHQEIELALAKLYELTGDEKHLRLGQFFIDERGQAPHFFTQEWKQRKGFSEWTKQAKELPKGYEYNQAHLPVREQDTAVGHAVRAVYMYAAMSEMARHTADETLLDACRTVFKDVYRQMYVTGGIGSTNHGEAFTFAYDLPNDINYSETCASIGLIFFMHSMLKSEVKRIYSDVIERVLYNTVLASLATDGKSYFYVNPMEAVPEASAKNPARKHVKTERQKWHACACCPPNIARMLASVGQYMYTTKGNTVYFHLYAASKAAVELSSGLAEFSVETQYPLNGDIKITLESDIDAALAFRVPGWCEHATFRLNNTPTDLTMNDGYAYTSGTLSKGDIIDIQLNMPPKIVRANTKIRANAGKVCLQRGPLIYCLEECDNSDYLHNIVFDTSSEIIEEPATIEGMPCITLTAKGFVEETANDAKDHMYSFSPPSRSARELTFVPYHLWGNRGHGEMLVWVRGI